VLCLGNSTPHNSNAVYSEKHNETQRAFRAHFAQQIPTGRVLGRGFGVKIFAQIVVDFAIVRRFAVSVHAPSVAHSTVAQGQNWKMGIT